MKTLNLNRKSEVNSSNGTSPAPAVKSGAMPNSVSFEEPKAEAKKEQASQGAKPEAVTGAKAEAKTDAPKSEQAPKPEIAKVEAVKPALNLESTLKLVEELHKRKIYRDNLLNTIKTLDDFKVMLSEDSEEFESVEFQGCKLTIEDDDRNTFVTKNPALIKAVADFVNKKCVGRLAEIEADIVIPA